MFGCFGSVDDKLHFCLCPGLVASRFLPTYCGHLLLLRGFQRCPFGTAWKGCERAIFGLPELGFRWCLAVSDPLPTSFIFAFVQAWLRHGFCPPTAAIYFSLEGFKGALSAPCGRVANAPFLACLSSDLGGVWLFRIRCRRASFCLCPGLVASRFLSTYCGHLLLLRGFQRCPFGTVWKGCERAVFGLPELRFRWCLAVSDPLPTSFIFAFVQAWLRHGFCPPTAAIYFSLEGFKGALSAPRGRVANAPFLACLSSDLGGVWLFRIRCRRASFLPLSRLVQACDL